VNLPADCEIMQFDVGWNLDLRFCKEASFSGKDNVIKSK
jgi:hypothetical protein